MIIFPAIDIKDGKCVRLLQGRARDETVYGDKPYLMAKKWAAAGAGWLHVVDLDGAFSGTGKNMEAIAEIVRAADIPVQLGGGIRTIRDVEDRLIGLKVRRVILGTAAVTCPDLVKEACARFPGRVAVGIDARDGWVSVKGWVERTEVSPVALALSVKPLGVDTIVYTDISRDGMFSGVNIAATKDMIDKTGMRIIASGGIGTLDDVRDVRAVKAAGVIIGKAFYEGSVLLEDALRLQEDS